MPSYRKPEYNPKDDLTEWRCLLCDNTFMRLQKKCPHCNPEKEQDYLDNDIPL